MSGAYDYARERQDSADAWPDHDETPSRDEIAELEAEQRDAMAKRIREAS